MFFILCIDALYKMLQLAVSHSLLPPVGVGDVIIHTLQFADDLLLFFDGNSRSAEVIKIVLDAFSAASGLKINFSKSRIIPINMESSQATRIARIFGCTTDGFPFTYLGLPLSPKALHKTDYLPLIEKIDKRLAGWKGRMLSRASRLVLLNSVISSVPTFFSSAFRILDWLFKAVDRIRRGFFWKGKVPTSSFHCLVNWEQVCRPKCVGGLGIRSFRVTNSALLMKSFWNYYSAKELPWVRILHHNDYKRRSPCARGAPPTRCSPLWKGVLSTTGPFHTSVIFTLGDGAIVPFWHARWTGDKLLRNRFPSLFASTSHKHISVNCWLHRFASSRNLGFSNILDHDGQGELSQLNIVIRNTSLVFNSDANAWRWNSNRRFSARSAYNFLVFDDVDDRRILHLWNIKIPLHIKIFLWLAARNRVPTADLLIKRGWYGPSICLLCSCDEECLEHLLFRCSYARSVWSRVLQGNQHLLTTLLNESGDLATRWRRTRLLIEGRVQDYLDA